MTIRKRTYTAIAITGILLLLALALSARVLILNSFHQLEERGVLSAVSRVVAEFSDQLSQLESTATDWGAWDETYHFLDNLNQAYISGNLQDDTLTTLNLHFMVFLDNQGNIVHAKAVSEESGSDVVLSPSLGASLAQYTRLWFPSDGTEPVSSFLAVDGSFPVIAAAQPVLRSNRTGPQRGTLVIGRYLTPEAVAQVGEKMRSQIDVWTLSEGPLPPDAVQAWRRLSASPSVEIRELDNEHHAGYTQLVDLDEAPFALLRVTIGRDLRRQGMNTMAYTVGAVLLVGISFTLLIGVLLENTVLGPLSKINAGVIQLQSGDAETINLTTISGEEVHNLGTAINELMHNMRTREQSLRESEEQIRLLLASTAEAIYGINLEGLCIFCNQSCVKMLGYASEADLIGHRMHALTRHSRGDGAELVASQCPVHNTLRRGTFNHSEDEIFYRRDGIPFQVEYWSYPIRRGDQLVGAVVTFLDITKRRQAEEERTRLAAAVQHAADAIYVMNTSGALEYLNPAAESMAGISASAALGLDTLSLLRADQDAEEKNQTLSALAAGEAWRSRCRNRRSDGTEYEVESTLSPVFAENGDITHIVAVERDLSDQIRLEARLQQQQRVEAVGRLAGGVAHDFNNLLQVILGRAEMLTMDLPGDSPEQVNAGEIIKAGNKAASLIRQLLAFSRQQVLQPKKLDLNCVVQDMAGMLQRLIGDDVVLHTTLDPELGTVEADPGQLEQVLMNLAVNAREAMPVGGQLTLETANLSVDEGFRLTHPQIAVGHYAVLAVSDTGKGIPPEIQEHVFEPFFSTKERSEGAGLGLSTVYGIVKQSGGYVYLESTPGVGTRFMIYLPLVASLHRSEETTDEEATLPQGNEHVLLVEDDPMVRAMVRAHLLSCGYRVTEAQSAGDALLIAERNGAPFQVLLTDVVMPTMTGVELAERLLPQHPQLHVLFMSGYTDNSVVPYNTPLQSRAGFLQKPFSRAELAQTMRDLIEGHPPGGGRNPVTRESQRV